MADKYLTSNYSGSGGNMMYLELHVYTIATSIANNTTTERADLYVVVNNSSYQWWNNYGSEAFIGIEGNNTTQTVNFDFRSTGVKALISSWDTVVKHNSNGTASIGISAHHYSGLGLGNASVSGTYTCDTIPRYANFTKHSINSKTETTVTVNWDADSECDAIQYSLNGGGWTTISGYPNYTITGLSAYTSYTIKTRIRRKDSQLWTESGVLSVTTYNYPYCTEAPDFTIGNALTIKFYNPLNRTIKIQMWSHVSLNFVSDLITTNGTSYTGFNNITNRLYSSIPNSTQSKYNIDVYYENNKAIKEGGNYYIIGNENPAFSNFDYADINSTTVALTGSNQKLISGYSNLQITVPTSSKATGRYYAGISKYVAIVGGTSKSANEVNGWTVTFDTYNKVTSNAMSVYAVDTRGLQSNVVYKAATLISYTKPVISSATNLKRVGGVGTDVNFNFSATFWNGNFGSVSNTITKIEYAKIDATSSYFNWDSATWYTIPSERYTISGNTVKNTSGALLTGFTLGTSYVVRIRIVDKLDSNYIELIVNNGDIIVAFNKTKKLLGVGKIPSTTLREGSIDVKGDVAINGTVKTQSDKYIMDFRGHVNDGFTFNQAIDTGIYSVGSNNGLPDAPYTGWIYGLLEVIVNDMTTWNKSNNWIFQRFKTTTGLIYERLAINNGNWSSWNQIAQNVGEAAYKNVKTLSNVGSVGWNGQSDGDSYLVTKAFMAFWNGLYSDAGGSNLIYCRDGTIQAKPYILYENSTGTTGTVTLSDNAANYNYLEIFYRRNANLAVWSNHFYKSTRIDSPNGKMASISVSYPAETTTTQVSSKLVLISGTSITVQRECYANIVQGAVGQSGTQNTVYITKVVGYR